MAYSTSIPPMAYIVGIGAMPTLWVYRSTDDDGTVNGAGYFTDGVALGMKVGDIVIVVDTTTPQVSFNRVSSVNTTTGTATTAFGAVA